MKIKICGMKDAGNIRDIAVLKPDYLGFILYPPSRRYVGDTLAADSLRQLPEGIGRVGVFVNAARADIVRWHACYDFDLVQLHGDEPADDCRWLQQQGIACMKVFAPGQDFRWEITRAYEPYCSYFLFDTPSPARGGSGLPFDWSVLAHYQGDTPFFLSGGIGPDNVEAALQLGHQGCAGLDLNSRLELQPGVKIVATSHQIIQKIRNYANLQS